MTDETPPDPKPLRLLPNAPYHFTWNGRDYYTGLYASEDDGFITVVNGRSYLVPLSDVWQATLQAAVFARDVLALVGDDVPDLDPKGDSTPQTRMGWVIHRLIEEPEDERTNVINPIGPALRFRDLDPPEEGTESMQDFLHMVGGPVDGLLTTVRRPALEAAPEPDDG